MREKRNSRSSGGLELSAGGNALVFCLLVFNLLVFGFLASRFQSFGGAHVNGRGGLAPEGNLHSIDGVNGGVAGWRAAQYGYQGIGNKAHVHQVVLYGFRQIEAH
jgi:hypothetical protein